MCNLNTITIRRCDNNKVIFSHTCENNTIGKTVKEAIRQGISLVYANLLNADLSNIDFSGVNLSYANLSWSNLNDCNLSYADLSYSNCFRSDFNNCNLTGTNLKSVELDHTNLTNVDLINAVGINDQCPKEGSFIGWKKCLNKRRNKEYIVKLEIPADAKRSSATTNKCRCDKAKVLEIQYLNGNKAKVIQVISNYDKPFIYKVGEMVYPDSFDDRFWVECSHGIHFFMNRQDAVDYDYY